MRLLADENIATSVIASLRTDGHDVESIRDTAPGVTDEVVIRMARQSKRIIDTHDRDFGNVIRYPIGTHLGVVLIRCRNQSPAHIARTLGNALRTIPLKKFQRRMAVLTEDEIRFYPYLIHARTPPARRVDCLTNRPLRLLSIYRHPSACRV